VKEEKCRKQLIDFDSSQSCPKVGDDMDACEIVGSIVSEFMVNDKGAVKQNI
jgi:hypothetical protein